MKTVHLTLPQVGMIAGTRGALGAGIGLLLGSRLDENRRKQAGLALLLVGALTTIPLVIMALRSADTESDRETFSSEPDSFHTLEPGVEDQSESRAKKGMPSRSGAF